MHTFQILRKNFCPCSLLIHILSLQKDSQGQSCFNLLRKNTEQYNFMNLVGYNEFNELDKYEYFEAH